MNAHSCADILICSARLTPYDELVSIDTAILEVSDPSASKRDFSGLGLGLVHDLGQTDPKPVEHRSRSQEQN
jgi:hypothetical protein